jgi:hypothetical protein
MAHRAQQRGAREHLYVTDVASNGGSACCRASDRAQVDPETQSAKDQALTAAAQGRSAQLEPEAADPGWSQAADND